MNLTEFPRTKKMLKLDDETVFKHHKGAIYKSLFIAWIITIGLVAAFCWIVEVIMN